MQIGMYPYYYAMRSSEDTGHMFYLPTGTELRLSYPATTDPSPSHPSSAWLYPTYGRATTLAAG